MYLIGQNNVGQKGKKKKVVPDLGLCGVFFLPANDVRTRFTVKFPFAWSFGWDVFEERFPYLYPSYQLLSKTAKTPY